MYANGVERNWHRYDPRGDVAARSPRHTALLAIEEVLGQSAASEAHAVAPVGVPETMEGARESVRKPQRARHRCRRKATRPGMVGLTLVLAICLGVVFGSGFFNPQARFNAERYAAQLGMVEAYGPPQVHGHPGAAPTRQRSASIREFLGMASAF